MNCDSLARWYRWLEYAGFGRALERRREAFLPELVGARRVLMLGEGDGRFLAGFLRRNPSAQVDYVDSSAKMLALAQRRACRASSLESREPARVRFHHADVLAWLRSPLGTDYDVVCTHFILDCFTNRELETFGEQIARVTTDRSVWVVSEFSHSSAGPRQKLFQGIVILLYWFFRVTTGLRVRRLPDHRDAMVKSGFRLLKNESGFGGLLVSEWWERL